MIGATENCCSAPAGVITGTVCRVDPKDGGGSSLRHDAFVAAWAVVGTCAAIAAYNYYIDRRLRAMKRKREAEDSSAEKDDAGLENHGTTTRTTRAADGNEFAASLAASLARVEGREASGNFLSAVLSQMWEHVNVAVSNAIKDALDPTLKELKPAPLHFTRLDLGNVPVETRNMFIHRADSERGAGIQIDVDVEWDGNCDIMLQATLSRSVKVNFGVEKVKLSGRMHILLGPLTNELPIVSSVQYGFINPPDLRLTFSGAATVLNELGIVRSTLPSVIQSSLADVLVLPQRLVMPIDLGSYDFLDTYRPPVGLARITALGGRGFKVQRKHYLINDIPDVYCKISLGASEHFRTSTQNDDLNPSWKDESCDFILYDMDQKIYVQVFDQDTAVDSDHELGRAEISTRDLFRNGGMVDLELESDDEKNGCFVSISAELFYLSDRLHSLSSPVYKGKNHLSGLVTIIVTKAFDIPIRKEDAATYVKIVYGEGSDHEKTFYTGTVMDYPGYDALNPMYDCVFHVPITTAMVADDGLKKNRDANSISFTLVDGEGANGSKGRGELGTIMVTHETLCKAHEHTMTKTSPIGNEGAKLEYRISLSGMQSEDEFVSRDNTSQTINARKLPEPLYGGIEESGGVDIRVTAVRGRGFSVRKRHFGKKDDVPDVYCNIRLKGFHNDSPLWKTATIKDDTMPQWNESKDFNNVLSSKSMIIVEVFDENSKGKDNYLGSAEFSVEQLLRKRLMEVELKGESGLTRTYVTLKCIEVKSFGKRASDHGINAIGSDDKVLVHYHPHIGDDGYESTLLLEQTPSQEFTPQPADALNPPESSRGKTVVSEDVDVRVTAVGGRGFQVRKRNFGRKDDIPDVFLKIRVKCPNRKEHPHWTTATIKNDTTPQWNEHKNFIKVHSEKATIRVDAYEDNMVKDDCIGAAEFPVDQLLRMGTLEAELQKESTLTKTYVTLRCIELGSSSKKGIETNSGVNAVVHNEEVLVHYHPSLGDEGFESTLLEQSKK